MLGHCQRKKFRSTSDTKGCWTAKLILSCPGRRLVAGVAVITNRSSLACAAKRCATTIEE
jgi:hypothetical protein